MLDIIVPILLYFDYIDYFNLLCTNRYNYQFLYKMQSITIKNTDHIHILEKFTKIKTLNIICKNEIFNFLSIPPLKLINLNVEARGMCNFEYFKSYDLKKLSLITERCGIDTYFKNIPNLTDLYLDICCLNIQQLWPLKNLKRLTFGKKFAKPITAIHRLNNLEKISFGPFYNYKIDALLKLPNLKKIQINNTNFEHPIPDKLRTITHGINKVRISDIFITCFSMSLILIVNLTKYLNS